jgi:tetratricopeptide (TPR) repeat protein
VFCNARLYLHCFFSILLLLAAGCSRPQEGTVQRLAILPFENLSADASLDWLSRGVPGTLAAELITSPQAVVLSIATPNEVYDVRAAEAVAGYFEVIDRRLRITASVRDARTHKTLRTVQVEGDAARGALPLIHELATRLANGQIDSVGTSNEAAARAFWSSFDANTPDARIQLLRAAIAADPEFPLPYVTLAQTAIAGRDAAEARADLESALRSPRLSPYRRARVQVLDATLRNDSSGRLRALSDITRIAPNDHEAWRSLADGELARRNFAGAIAALKRALEIDAQDTAAMNVLAYAEAYSGNLEAAKAALESYRKVAPNDANAVDSLGDVHFHLNRFKEAEQYYVEAHRMNAGLLAGGDLYKAALARCYAAGVRGGDEVFAGFLEFRKGLGDGILPVREAVWEALTGRIEEARIRLQQFLMRTDVSATVRFAASLQLTFFAAEQGGVARIEGTPPSPIAQNLASLASTLAQPDVSAAEWEQRTARFGPQAVGYALLLHRHYREAAVVWERIYKQAHPNFASEPRVMLAWAYKESGRVAEAEKLLVVRPTPPGVPEPGLAYLMFLEDRRLAGASPLSRAGLSSQAH